MRKRMTSAHIIATLALVFAMTGGAYAAKHYLITSTKQISPKVLSALKGKTGPAGPIGPAGTAGAKGETGLAGKEGAKGETGATGKEGAKGATGPTGLQGATGPTGLQGATGAAGATGAQGATGPKGVTGEPWTPNNTLPSKASEAGQWATYSSAAEASSFASAAVSIPIPLKAALTEEHVYFIGPEEAEGEAKVNKTAFPAHCKGKVGAPAAEPGNLCIFAANLNNLALFFLLDQETNGSGVSGRTGTTLIFASKAAGPASAGGTWAVTEK